MKPSATHMFLPVMLIPHWWPVGSVGSTGLLQVLDVVSHSVKYVCIWKLLLGELHQKYSTSGPAPLYSNFVMGSLARMVSSCSVVGYLGWKTSCCRKFPVYIAMAHPLQWWRFRKTEFKWHGPLSRRRKRGRSRQQSVLPSAGSCGYLWLCWFPDALQVPHEQPLCRCWDAR